MKIQGTGAPELAVVVAQLVREGVQFEAYLESNECWTITLTGGF